MNPLLSPQPRICLPTGFLSRDLPPPKSSIHTFDSGSSLSLGHSIEIPVLQTSPDATEMPSSNAPPLTMGDINVEDQGHLSQEFINKLDKVCRPAIASPHQAKAPFR